LRFRIGTAAWGNPPGERTRRGPVSHLVHYAKSFNAVEINSSFYRPHLPATYERWRAGTPWDFRFSVKMPRTITHDAGLRRCQTELRRFLDEISALRSKLRVILVQLPASLEFEARVAARFFGTLAAQSAVRVACEPRHPDWFGVRADEFLRRHGVARVAADPCAHSGGNLPGGSQSLVYHRLHGSPRMYYSRYSKDFLSGLAGRIREPRSATDETWCIFDNTARHEAWPNARELRRMLSKPRRRLT
jgi:uncharacterized protein YecE (DUF72 family)